MYCRTSLIKKTERPFKLINYNSYQQWKRRPAHYSSLNNGMITIKITGVENKLHVAKNCIYVSNAIIYWHIIPYVIFRNIINCCLNNRISMSVVTFKQHRENLLESIHNSYCPGIHYYFYLKYLYPSAMIHSIMFEIEFGHINKMSNDFENGRLFRIKLYSKLEN
ncbi:hypothetical protein BDC45DRAFT_535655 [Circinella umbellata]|nr:hypothetical protein BDC45DRAFT_535655 [Circinella umbellata]